MFQTTLFAKSDLVKASLKNGKAAQKSTTKKQDLIDQADVLVKAIHNSLTLSTLRAIGASREELWWNESCQDVV